MCSGKGLLNRIIDINLVMGTCPGKASGDQHRVIEHKRHGMVGARNKHRGGQKRKFIRRRSKQPRIANRLAPNIPPGNKHRASGEQHYCMTRAIGGRIRCLRKHLRTGIICIGLFSPDDQDPSIWKQRRSVAFSSDCHEMSCQREFTRRRAV